MGVATAYDAPEQPSVDPPVPMSRLDTPQAGRLQLKVKRR
jgi:hypothetical protein